MTETNWNLLTQGGGLTAFIGFAYLILKALLKQVAIVNKNQERLTDKLENHLKADIKQLEIISNRLEKIQGCVEKGDCSQP